LATGRQGRPPGRHPSRRGLPQGRKWRCLPSPASRQRQVPP
jgi:hypothetical protein